MLTDRPQILWLKFLLGDTRSLLGIYRIVYALQVLASWSRDEFFPWYKVNILGMLREV